VNLVVNSHLKGSATPVKSEFLVHQKSYSIGQIFLRDSMMMHQALGPLTLWVVVDLVDRWPSLPEIVVEHVVAPSFAIHACSLGDTAH